MTAAQTPAPKRHNTALLREVGLIGLIWASMGSIIGSGWLFGAQEALIAAGPAAIISWVIGGVAILVLALVHAELGGMYPVSGGTARFPHYAFGGVAGASFGWFSWLKRPPWRRSRSRRCSPTASTTTFAARLDQPEDRRAHHHRASSSR